MQEYVRNEGKVKLNGAEQAIIVHYNPSAGKKETAYVHMHDYIEVLYCDRGSFCACLDGKNYSFSEGDMIVINSRESHSMWRESDESGGYICVRFLPEVLYTSTASTFDMKYMMPFILNSSKHQRVFKREEINNTFIPGLLYDMLEEYQNKEYGYELAVRADVSKIFLWIIRYWHRLNIDLSSDGISDFEMIKRIEGVCEYVSENFSDDIKASEMAEMCNLSYSYFSRVFKQYMKKSFSEYLCFVRITNAEKLLTSSDKSITDIASFCGFSTTSYFIKQFREYKGVSPKQFKKSFT